MTLVETARALVDANESNDSALYAIVVNTEDWGQAGCPCGIQSALGYYISIDAADDVPAGELWYVTLKGRTSRNFIQGA